MGLNQRTRDEPDILTYDGRKKTNLIYLVMRVERRLT